MKRLVFAMFRCVIMGAANSASAQYGCMPPVPPDQYYSPKNEQNYGDEIRQEYLSYFDQANSYFYCLEQEKQITQDAANDVLKAYQAFERRQGNRNSQ